MSKSKVEDSKNESKLYDKNKKNEEQIDNQDEENVNEDVNEDKLSVVSDDYVSEDEIEEVYQNESNNIIQLAQDRKILDENEIKNIYNLNNPDGKILQEKKLE